MIAVTGVLLVTLLGLTHVILLVGLRRCAALAESAARLGQRRPHGPDAGDRAQPRWRHRARLQLDGGQLEQALHEGPHP